MTMNVNTTGDPVEEPMRVFLAEDISALAADIAEGTGLVFDYTYVSTVAGELATDPCGIRCNRVKLVTTAGGEFAGVLAKAVKKDPGNTTGCWVYVYKPGSFCKILANAATTLGDILVCSKNAASLGKFVAVAAEVGTGTAVCLQTHAATGSLVLGKLRTGTICTLQA